MLLQDAADESEARAVEALDGISDRTQDMAAIGVALEALGELARVEAAERVAAGRWGAHVSDARALARRALAQVVEATRDGARRPPGQAEPST